MPLTPQITLTATLEDLLGAAAGTTANPAKLIIALCNYNRTLPQIAGTSTLAKVLVEELSTGGQISVALWGNDVITPVGQTWYAITVMDGEGNIVQTANYQFTGTQTVDLSDATPYNPPAPPQPPVPGLTTAECNPQGPQAAETTYTAPGPVVAVFYGTNLQRPGVDYDFVTGSTTQFVLHFSIATGDAIYAICYA